MSIYAEGGAKLYPEIVSEEEVNKMIDTNLKKLIKKLIKKD